MPTAIHRSPPVTGLSAALSRWVMLAARSLIACAVPMGASPSFRGIHINLRPPLVREPRTTPAVHSHPPFPRAHARSRDSVHAALRRPEAQKRGPVCGFRHSRHWGGRGGHAVVGSRGARGKAAAGPPGELSSTFYVHTLPCSAQWGWRQALSPQLSAGAARACLQVLSDEQKDYVQWHNARRDARRRKPTEDEAAREKAKAAGEEDADEAAGRSEKTKFHGKEQRDALGKSWLEPPKDRKKENETCFLPKRWIHTWAGHTKGVSAIRFFPKYGHLLLSAGMDTKIKIWDVHGSGKCMRTYMGHDMAVKDICFSNDGSRFLSTSFDKQASPMPLRPRGWGGMLALVSAGRSAGSLPGCCAIPLG